MAEKLKIDNLDDLRITKVRDWLVLFKYAGNKYLLKDSLTDEFHTTLYKRNHVHDGVYSTECLGVSLSSKGAKSFIRDISKVKRDNITYSNVDKEYFVKILMENGFVSSKYDDAYDKYLDEMEEIDRQLGELGNKKDKIKKLWRVTEEHGSKTSTLQHKFKVRACERIKGAKEGDWCEEFKQAYGSEYRSESDEKIGILTDLFSLTYGTHFYCVNGKWDGVIIYDKHGDKAVCTKESIVTLTKEHHSAYIL